jgi:adenine phosphoribosyltransferase
VDQRIDRVKRFVRDIADFPKPGIVFKDWLPLLADPEAFADAVALLAEPFRNERIDQVLGMEARGFLLGIPIAMQLGAGFVPVRKKGKLPYDTYGVTYELEYGTDTLEMHVDAVLQGQRILIVDDLLATGGTAAATVELVGKARGDVIGCAFLIELDFLDGRARLGVDRVHSLIRY